MADSKNLRESASDALKVLHQTRNTLSDMGHIGSERTATVLPLVLASMGTAEAIYALLINQPEKSWVAALIMQRAQMEYVLRAAFFAKAANDKEIARFRRKGKMPNRGKNQIYVADVAKEAAQHLGWDEEKLLRAVKSHYRDLSGLVHGGKEVLAIYTQHDAWGDITIEWDELTHAVDNILVFAQLALGAAMSLSPLDAEAMDRLVRPSYEAAHAYFGQRGPEV
ncbi:hypothetical protein [Marilutibacter aestuarii]|uniref:AbiV family abortive infection protein n=1 Tax=Marilutibacter aestuarii TaxID=1706195 RepID=A0A507ZND8_9GAMM|nr:hypothetical protein [Lysobacter aestuarii]TQD39246.1 hypothetical protein FKV25_15595 [Lysobacter aestuarii]